jgi:hypothetical protein
VLSDISGRRAFEVAMDVLARFTELGRMRKMAAMINKTVARKSCVQRKNRGMPGVAFRTHLLATTIDRATKR